MSYEDYFYKVKKDVFKTETFEEFCKLHSIFESFLEHLRKSTWLEKHYDAVKARPDKEIYCARTLQLPKALKFSDVFSDFEIKHEKTTSEKGFHYCSTWLTDESLIKDGWQGDKFYHLRVKPTQETIKAFDDHIGGNLGSFEIFQRDDEFLIIAESGDSSIFQSWIAIVYDIPKSLGELTNE